MFLHRSLRSALVFSSFFILSIFILTLGACRPGTDSQPPPAPGTPAAKSTPAAPAVPKFSATTVTTVTSAASVAPVVPVSSKFTFTPETSIYEVPVTPMAGDTHTSGTLAPYRGKVLLIVNVASECGYTPQYAGLERLYRKYRDRGFVVLGFPSNDFKEQEPGSEAEILQFCRATYDVTFPIYGKIHVLGKEKAPLYYYLTIVGSWQAGLKWGTEISWNFEKFLVNHYGSLVARFPPATEPESAAVTMAIEQELHPINSIYDPSNGTIDRSGLYPFKQ